MIRLPIYTLSFLAVLGCSSTPPSGSGGADDLECKYELTPENYEEYRANCRGFIRQENYEEIAKLRNRDALKEAESLAVPYEFIVLAALRNRKSESYCLEIFGKRPSDKLVAAIELEDELLNCSEKRISRVSLTQIKAEKGDRFRVYVIYDCGLTGSCQSAWWVILEENESGELQVIDEVLDWIT